ncbi:MAG TPA: hypothetical protein VFD01_03130 [Candidatus Dormibacteraeota bacterium]|jgi:hypothetical protein|nr:hypothetical protein [Candidatus Dormibacteraeota bacterium]
MSRYATTGWYEFLLPVRTPGGEDHLRVWIEMQDVVPMLRRLDRIYGDPEHPYCRDLTRVPDAARDLVSMVMEHVIERPDRVRRIAVRRGLFAELRERLGIRSSAYPVPYPEAIDQVDLDLAQASLLLPLLLDPGRAGPGGDRG